MKRGFFVLMGLVIAGCRVHTLEDGAYALTVTEVLRDDCAMSGAGYPSGATLVTNGHQVAFTLDGAQPAVTLEGTYLYNVEQLMLDGSQVNATQTLNGASCLVDTVRYHLEGVDQSATQFNGSMSIEWQTKANDACVCRYWFKFSATRK